MRTVKLKADRVFAQTDEWTLFILLWNSKYFIDCIREQGRLSSACADAQVDLSLPCSHMTSATFSTRRQLISN